MDSLKSLMDKKQYELVIKLTETTFDATSLFYRISAFLALGKGVDALITIENNREILESDLNILIKIHIEILCLLGDFDKAYEELKHYQGLPYVSQSVEETLRSMPEFIRLEERKSFGSKQLSDEQLRKQLASKDTTEVIMALDIVRERNVNDFIVNIKDIMLNFPKQNIRSFALMLLVHRGFDKEVSFKQKDEIMKVIPSNLNPPFVGEDFNNLTKKMGFEYRDPTLTETAVQLLASHMIYIYPLELEYTDEITIEALYHLASDYLKIEKSSSLEERCIKKGLNVEKVIEAIKSFDESSENF